MNTQLSGISLGEIGPRLGINSQDNGYLRFHHYHIPRTNLLMRHSQVLEVRHSGLVIKDSLSSIYLHLRKSFDNFLLSCGKEEFQLSKFNF